MIGDIHHYLYFYAMIGKLFKYKLSTFQFTKNMFLKLALAKLKLRSKTLASSSKIQSKLGNILMPYN